MIRDEHNFREILPAGYDGLFDWDFLIPAFEGTKITPSDIDMIVERNGKFLVVETKTGGAGIPRGQEILLEQLVKIGRFIVIILRCKTPADIHGWTVWYKRGKDVRKKEEVGDANALREYIARWFRWANGFPPSEIEDNAVGLVS